MIMSKKAYWREIRRKIKNGDTLTGDEQRKLDKWVYVWIFISIGVSLPMSLVAITLSLLTVLCKP